MKKKLWIIAVVAMLVVAVLASLAACGNLFSKNDEPVEPEDELTAEEPEVEATEEPEETAQPEEPEATKTPASTGKGTGSSIGNKPGNSGSTTPAPPPGAEPDPAPSTEPEPGTEPTPAPTGAFDWQALCAYMEHELPVGIYYFLLDPLQATGELRDGTLTLHFSQQMVYPMFNKPEIAEKFRLAVQKLTGQNVRVVMQPMDTVTQIKQRKIEELAHFPNVTIR